MCGKAIFRQSRGLISLNDPLGVNYGHDTDFSKLVNLCQVKKFSIISIPGYVLICHVTWEPNDHATRWMGSFHPNSPLWLVRWSKVLWKYKYKVFNLPRDHVVEMTGNFLGRIKRPRDLVGGIERPHGG